MCLCVGVCMVAEKRTAERMVEGQHPGWQYISGEVEGGIHGD